jgi:hypothetical protein
MDGGTTDGRRAPLLRRPANVGLTYEDVTFHRWTVYPSSCPVKFEYRPCRSRYGSRTLAEH